MEASINYFCQTFWLLVEVRTKFDKKKLEAVGVLFALKHLPMLFLVFQTMQFGNFKDKTDTLSMEKFLTDLETKFHRQQETTKQLTSCATSLAAQLQANQLQANKPPAQPKTSWRNRLCTNKQHNPKATFHTEENCFQVHPEKEISHYEALINKLQKSKAHLRTSTKL